MDLEPANKRSDEEHVKAHTVKWLNEVLASESAGGDGSETETTDEGTPRFALVIPEYQVADGRLDFVAARWKNDYQLDIVGVECKGKTNPASLWAITSGQLSRYLRLVPELYFACISPAQVDALKEYEALCRIAKVGLLAMPEAHNRGFTMHEVSSPPYSPSALFDGDDYLRQTRSRVVMYLTFNQQFKARYSESLRMGPDWISTPEPTSRPQFSAWVDNGAIWAGVNIENAKDVLRQVASDRARTDEIVRLIRELGERSRRGRLSVGQFRMVGAGRRVTLPVLQKRAESVSEVDLKCICEAARGKALHFSVIYPLWRQDEALLRSDHQRLMDDAFENNLKPLFDLLTELR